MDRETRRPSSWTVRWTVGLVAAIYVAWIGAWLLKLSLDRQSAWTATPGGAFAYWTVAKFLLWVVPSLAFIQLSGRRTGEVIGLERLRPALAWGVPAGLALGAISLATRAALHKPLLSAAVGWPLITLVVVAPLFEEFMFRGAVLGALVQQYRFAVANVVTAALFLGMHLPGWHFQGRLLSNLTAAVGGALSIFLLGLVFGFVAHRSGSLGASVVAHALNNLSV
jgi:hypothetical protein